MLLRSCRRYVRFEKLSREANLAPDSLVFADKGYSSMKNRATLEESYIDGIMHKAVRGPTAYLRPASYEQADQQCALSG